MKTILTLTVVIALTGCATITDTVSTVGLARDLLLLAK